MSTDLTIQRCGDTELWVVAGEGWELPVLADPYSTKETPEFFRLRTPLDAKLSIQMLKALDERLNPLKVPTSASHVIIKYEDLPRIASKARGITPGYYVKWGGEEAANPVDEERLLPDPPTPDSGKDFCAYLHRLTGVVEYSTLRLVWKAIMQVGPRWLAEEKKPIDLGFVRIVPMPFRANWKSIMHARFPQGSTILLNREAWQHKKVDLEHIGFMAELFNTVLAAFSVRKKFCYWTLEAVATPLWWKATEQYEFRKIGQLGPTRYAEYWRRGINKMLPHIVGAYQEWSKLNRLPCAQLDEGALFGSRRLIPWVPQGRIRPAAPSSGDACIVVDPVSTQLKGPPETQKIRRAPNDMLELSDILPEPQYVRLLKDKGSQHDVSQPQDPELGADGVLVFDDREGEDTGSDLLASGSGPSGGVDGQPERDQP